MTKLWRRSLSLFLALVMVMGMLPLNVLADDAEAETGETTVQAQSAETEAPATEAPATEAPMTEPPATQATEPASEPETTEAPAQTEAPAVPVETKSDDAAAATVTDAQASGNAALAEAQAENTASIQHFTVVPDAEGLPSDEELFQGYAEGVLYGNTAATFGIAAGKTLTGDVKLAYDALVPVLKQIASGERANATISVGHDLGTVTSQDGTVLGTYNAEVDASFTGTTFGDDEMHELLSALLADLPYDLYWFDKVAGFTASIVATTGTETTPGEMYLSFNFYVSKVYQGGSNLTVNASLTGAASKAAANAKILLTRFRSSTTATVIFSGTTKTGSATTSATILTQPAATAPAASRKTAIPGR